MYINQAIAEAQKKQVGIRRKSWRKYKLGVIPTNSSNLNMFLVGNNGKNGTRNWNPNANDLKANDWELF